MSKVLEAGGLVHRMRTVLVISDRRMVIACTGCSFYRACDTDEAGEVFLGHVPEGATALVGNGPVEGREHRGVRKQRGVAWADGDAAHNAGPSVSDQRGLRKPRVFTVKPGPKIPEPTTAQVALIWAIYERAGERCGMSGRQLATARRTAAKELAPWRHAAAALAISVTGLSCAQVARIVASSKSAVHRGTCEIGRVMARHPEVRNFVAEMAHRYGVVLPT